MLTECHTVTTGFIFSKLLERDTPLMARYVVYFVSSRPVSYFAFTIALRHSILCYIRPLYNQARLYIVSYNAFFMFKFPQLMFVEQPVVFFLIIYHRECGQFCNFKWISYKLVLRTSPCNSIHYNNPAISAIVTKHWSPLRWGYIVWY